MFNKKIMIVPPYLKKGDTIGIICSSGFMPYDNAQTCINTLQQWGYKVVVGKTLGNQFNYFSGTDLERLYDLQTMLDDNNIKAIIFGRGGYGLSRIIDTINFTKFKKNPKWLVGYSDITLLHSRVNTQLHVITLHSPMAAAFNNNGYKNEYVQWLHKTLKGIKQKFSCTAHNFNKQGDVSGELVGGNLCMMAHSIGSKSAYKTTNKILFIEDVGEYAYNIDRMLMQLKRNGWFKNLAGLIVGSFTDVKDTTIPFGATVYSIIKEHLAEYNFPVCYNFPVGHQTENYPLKIGANYRLTVGKNKVVLVQLV